MPATLRQMIVYRLNNAYERFFSQGDFPRFKAKNRYRSIELRQYGIDYKIDRKCLVAWKKYELDRIKTRGLQDLNDPKMARLIKRASGWYLQVIDEVPEAPTENKAEVGIDLGLKYFLADSEGNKIEPPKFFRKSLCN